MASLVPRSRYGSYSSIIKALLVPVVAQVITTALAMVVAEDNSLALSQAMATQLAALLLQM